MPLVPIMPTFLPVGPGEHKTFEECRSWKGQLFKRCDVGVVNIDDENTEALLEGHTCKLVTYGRSEKADYRAEGCELWLDTSISATSQPASTNWRKVFCSS